MKFNEYVYVRPNLEEVQGKYASAIEKLNNVNNVDEFMEVFKEVNVLRNNISTMSTLSSLRYTINTSDEFYAKENDYWDENGPFYQQLDTQLYKCILESKFIDELKERIPAPFFGLIECQLKAFDDCILEDLQLENKVSTEYDKLKASAKIDFDGEVYNLPGISALCESKDRDVRKRASKAKFDFYVEHEAEFDRIYDDLVKIRDKMAKKLGFNNFTELGYVRMTRLDYNEEMVKNYRQEVLEHVVPLAVELTNKQQKRLGLDNMQYYDLGIEFESGNPTPKGTPEELVLKAKQMYRELSKETGEFFDMMVDKELLDLVSKPNKAGGGYCTFINDYKVPFIFSNFNGTSGDVDVLTHEAGHAFQVYMSRDNELPELSWPTYESCEIHSMSMEFITWPWSKEFFKEDTDKYHYLHLSSAIKFLPYGILVDHFQHEVYNNPNMTPKERKDTWRKLEKMYLPYKNYEECDFLERGNYWFQQGHIFQSPFYYIDYTLAQMCSLQFFKRVQDNDPTMWQDYVNICKVGGTKSFLGILETAHLKSPFVKGSLKDVVKTAKDYLDSVDDTAL